VAREGWAVRGVRSANTVLVGVLFTFMPYSESQKAPPPQDEISARCIPRGRVASHKPKGYGQAVALDTARRDSLVTPCPKTGSFYSQVGEGLSEHYSTRYGA
jgi:hypothetical protein